MMSAQTLTDVLAFMDVSKVDNLDLTGGAPELNPGFRRLVTGARELGVHVIDRCNLTILEEPGQEDLAGFLARERVEIIASLPCYTEELVDRQRGKGVYEMSVRALKRLNALGYGAGDSGLTLNLVYNPQGPVLPPAQDRLEADYKRILAEQHGIVFSRLYVLANMPIQRFGSTLVSKGQFETYMALLHAAHRADNLGTVMCRTLVSVDWLAPLATHRPRSRWPLDRGARSLLRLYRRPGLLLRRRPRRLNATLGGSTPGCAAERGALSADRQMRRI